MKILRQYKRARRSKENILLRFETILNTGADYVSVGRSVSQDNTVLVCGWGDKDFSRSHMVYLSHDEIRRLAAFLPENVNPQPVS